MNHPSALFDAEKASCLSETHNLRERVQIPPLPPSFVVEGLADFLGRGFNSRRLHQKHLRGRQGFDGISEAS